MANTEIGEQDMKQVNEMKYNRNQDETGARQTTSQTLGKGLSGNGAETGLKQGLRNR